MNTVNSGMSVRKLDSSLKKAMDILGETYPYEVPLLTVRILCIVYDNHRLGMPTYLSDLTKEMGTNPSSASRHVSKLCVWANLKQRGAGYLDKGKTYNDAGYQINTIHMTEKGLAIMQRILEPID